MVCIPSHSLYIVLYTIVDMVLYTIPSLVIHVMVLYTVVYMAHLTSYYRCKQYIPGITNSTAVQQYMWFCCKRVHYHYG